MSRSFSGVALMALVVGVLAQPALSQSGNTRTTIALTAVGSEPNAAGSATIEIRTGEQGLDVRVGKMGSAPSYHLVVDGNFITAFTTNNGGAAQIRLSSSPKGQEQPLPASLTPVSNIRLVEIVDPTTGQVVLKGNFQ